MIRSGLRPEAPPASRIGSTGSTQGEMRRDDAREEPDPEQDEDIRRRVALLPRRWATPSP